MSAFRDVDCAKVRVWPWLLLATFPLPFCGLCNSLRHVVFRAVAFRGDASEFNALDTKVRCEMRAAGAFFKFLVAVAKHLLGADISIVLFG